MKYKWKLFEIHKNVELQVASGESNNKKDAEKELFHYIMQYCQDYPVKWSKNWK